MRIQPSKINESHGTGEFSRDNFGRCGKKVVFERGLLVFHAENIEIGENVYIGHNTILKGYYKNKMIIGDHTWIGQCCFLHSAGGIEIGRAVGIGPMVKIISSQHRPSESGIDIPVIFSPIEFKKVILRDGCDIGVGSVILPGVSIGEGAIVGAGSVVAQDVPDYEIWAGIPATFIRKRMP
jgi:acetyltransferase-like isoleucine patch superfamily enzyme